METIGMNLSKNKYRLVIALSFFASIIIPGCSGNDNTIVLPEQNGTRDWMTVADRSTSILVTDFWNASKKYFNNTSAGDASFQYWPQAHALDVIIDAYLRSSDGYYKSLMEDWFVGVKAGNGGKWKNSYYDDMAWIALGLERAYRATLVAKYKDAALELWDYIKAGWNDYAGGGIAWRESEPWKKNACSNGPACILACRLYRLTSDESMKQMALDIFNWEKSHLLDADAVLDHIDGRDGSLTSWVFTYNQGTYIGAAVELYRLTSDMQYLHDGMKVANNAMATLSKSGILRLEGSSDSASGNDAHLFKGILIRYLAELTCVEGLSDAAKARYASFIESNAESLWTKGTDNLNGYFGPDWTALPGDVTDLKSMVSGCTLMEAAALLKGKKYL